MNQRDIQQMRASRVRQIERIRLGGVDRVMLDREPTDPWERYAHIYENGCWTNLHDMPTIDSHPAYSEGPWRKVCVIDLDTGDVVEERNPCHDDPTHRPSRLA